MHPYMPYGHKERLSYMPNSLKKSSGSARALFLFLLEVQGVGFRVPHRKQHKP